jgi:ABC-2 type transport system permease protein
MKGFITLLKMQLNVNFGISALKYRFRKEKKKIGRTIAVFVSAALGIGCIVALYSLLMYSFYSAGVTIRNPALVLVIAFLSMQLFLLITGIFYVLSVFFYAKDMSALIPLPLKPWQVLGSKFAVVMAYEYLMALPVLLPPILIYGFGQAAGVLYWLKALLITLVSPALPLLIASLLAIVLMRFLNVGRRKDLLAIVGGLLTISVALGTNLLMQRYASVFDNPAAMGQLLANQAQFINSISSAFPPSAWATLALSTGGFSSLWYLMLYVAVSAALLFLMLWLANRVYYRSAAMSEETARRKKPAGVGTYAGSASASPVRAIFIKELKLLVRTPAYAMNCLAGSLVIPIIIPITLSQGKKAAAGIFALIQNSSNLYIAVFAAVGLMMFTAIINVTASSALSREGKSFWISKMIPVPPQKQVYAKFLISLAVAFISIALTAGMLVLLIKFSLYQGILALLLGLLGAVPVTAANMLPDLMKPKLLWTNPYEPVKQNMNVLLAMLIAFLLVAAEAALTVLLFAIGLNGWIVYLVLAAAQVILALMGFKALAAAASGYYKIEA